MEISGKTKILGLFGYPVTHTLSPVMHNTAFRASGFDYVYVAFEVKPEYLKTAVNSIKALNLTGVNVTIPHKEAVLSNLDEVDKEASVIGAVNTVVNRDGKLYGYNTDGRGFIESLKEEGILPEKKKVFLLGAGGASRAIAFSLAFNKASEIAIYDVDHNKAKELALAVSKVEHSCLVTIESPEKINDYEIVINATPLGLKNSDPLPFRPELIESDIVVYDVIYRRTRLLEEAKSKGANAIDGSGMLLWQGALAFELWTGVKAPVEVMRDALISNMA